MEERILYFDIVNGISGDMTIATLLDLGISKEVFLEEINKLNLGDEFNINIQEENEDGIVGTKVEVITKEVNAHRHLSDIYEIIDKSSLNEYVKENAKKIGESLKACGGYKKAAEAIYEAIDNVEVLV